MMVTPDGSDLVLVLTERRAEPADRGAIRLGDR